MQDRKAILYIEDNPGDVRLFEKMVSDCPMHITVHVANKLQAGIEMVQQNDFDAVLLDLELPDSQGLDSMKALMENHPNLPVIVLTGHLDEEVGIQAIQAGAQDYLVKGLD